MSFGVSGSTSVLHDDKGEAQASSLPRGRFDAGVGRNTSEDDGVDSTLLQFLLEIRACESSPVPFGDKQIARLKAGLWRKFRYEGQWRGRVRIAGRFINRELQQIRHVDANVDDRCSFCPEGLRQQIAFSNDFAGRIRCRGP